ncbi:hypothetical protein F3Y22_tig00001095pilonHSYRG00009 [Hibiscus syriacus]|uniref:Uncharacterized protein n=2 Tax=Hibiscus syriacus TaxID=106335 RepID=A0A6A3D2U0_HIBSY|nr:hypothetical protein F3Y22_tig00001095pilonHSYRG00009 [Hibiscus syriacus]
MHATFRNSILTITMPKQTITQTGSVQDANANKETTLPMAASMTSSVVEKQTDEKVLPPQTPRNAITDQPKASMEMGRQQNVNAPPKVQLSVRQEETQKNAAAAAAIATSTKQAEERTAGSTSTAAVEEKKRPKKVESSFLGRAKGMKRMETIMKSVKRIATDDYEDRQNLMNIGVSVLVVVAHGVYITNSYRSSGQAED